VYLSHGDQKVISFCVAMFMMNVDNSHTTDSLCLIKLAIAVSYK
jgi:hypothetical protein